MGDQTAGEFEEHFVPARILATALRRPPAAPGMPIRSRRPDVFTIGLGGSITAGDSVPKLSGPRSQVQGILGDEVDHVDVSIIKMGGAFDNGPFIGIK